MIHVPTNPNLHILFDLLAWGSGAALAAILYRWRLREAAGIVTRTGPLYAVAAAAGAIAGAWAFGSRNTALSAGAAPCRTASPGRWPAASSRSRSTSWLRGITGSTGGVFVGPLALGDRGRAAGAACSPGCRTTPMASPTSLPWARRPRRRHRPPSGAALRERWRWLAFLAVYLLGLRAARAWACDRGFYCSVLWYGAQRFAWEFLKPYPRLVGPLNLFHLSALGLVAYGLVLRCTRSPTRR